MPFGGSWSSDLLEEQSIRQGEAIIKGHGSYDLMLCLQLGIRYTVGKIIPGQRRDVRVADFGRQGSVWMSFPREGSQLTPPHQSDDFKWKDYCPMVFRDLRELFKIDPGEYMMSVCGNDALRELPSPGKSGSVFFSSQDDRFMIKTLRKSEVKVLLHMLPEYHQHVKAFENTLVTKFFGLHRVKSSNGQKFRFVVMGNMFCTKVKIHKRYDLKGSSIGRSTDKIKIDENTTFKDLDLKCFFFLKPTWRASLLKQLEVDIKFLEDQCIMDYSLLLGVHYRAPHSVKVPMSKDEQGGWGDEVCSTYPQGIVLVPRKSGDLSMVAGPHVRGRRLRTSASLGGEEVDLLLPGTSRLQVQLGVNMPARAGEKGGGNKEDVVLYMGIIDILQQYNITKKIKHAYKYFHHNSSSFSAVQPTFYSTRFLKFVHKIFPP